MKLHFCALLMTLCGALVAPLVFTGCSKPPAQTAVDTDVDYYTCTMHPSVHSKEPGKCPICSMDLVPVKKGAAQKSINNPSSDPGSSPTPEGASSSQVQSNEFTVPVERQQQIGVTYATVTNRPIKLTIRSVGVLEPNTAKVFNFVARVEGYVHELKVSSPGEDVARDQPLLTMYSPDLRSTEQELVNLLNDRDRGAAGRSSSDPLIEAAKRRLNLWNVSDQEIAELEEKRKPSDHLILRSPFSGVLEEVMTRPGMNVKVGDKLVSVLDLSELWVWAEFYENEIGLLRRGQPIQVSLSVYRNQTFQGKIAVINPVIDTVKRTARVRIDIPNSQGSLRPGMYADVELKVDAGEGLTIPVQAALPTGERMLVFVDRGKGKLEPRYIQVGRSFTTLEDQQPVSYYQVINGLQEGDRIVTSANFLIDAESQVQGALKDWQGEGGSGSDGVTR